MPYKDPEAKKENRRLKNARYLPQKREIERTYALKRFRLMGLEPVDLDDQNSDLFCNECLKESDRSEIYILRHEKYCSYYAEKIPVPKYVKVGTYA